MFNPRQITSLATTGKGLIYLENRMNTFIEIQEKDLIIFHDVMLLVSFYYQDLANSGDRYDRGADSDKSDGAVPNPEIHPFTLIAAKEIANYAVATQ